jgi:nicotinamidase-related amidase
MFSAGGARRSFDLSFKAALIVIDVQVGFEDPAWGTRNNPRAELSIGRLLSFWRMTKRPIFHIRHDSPRADSPLRPHQRGNAFKPQTAPLPGEAVIGKTVNSAFIGTSLEADLRRAQSPAVVLVGLTTNHCVSTTARMAANLGFSTFVVADATAAFGNRGMDGRMRPAGEVHDGALADLRGEFADIVETGALLDAATAE